MQGSPAYSNPQPDDAMQALLECTAKAETTIHVPPPLASYRAASGGPITVGLAGEHQEMNAALAVQLAAAWESDSQVAKAKPSAEARVAMVQQRLLPDEYVQGLAQCSWPGRSQIIEDTVPSSSTSNNSSNSVDGTVAAGASGRLTFYLDGAHTPESMLTCGNWFADCMQARASTSGTGEAAAQGSASVRNGGAATAPNNECYVVVFNCMKERDPAVLLPALHEALVQRGIDMGNAIFVPPVSQYGFLKSGTTQQQAPPQVDLTWQHKMQAVWASVQAPGARGTVTSGTSRPTQSVLPVPSFADVSGSPADTSMSNGVVLPSLPGTVEWLRASVAGNPQLHLRVLVTGSLYLVGDLLQVLDKEPV